MVVILWHSQSWLRLPATTSSSERSAANSNARFQKEGQRIQMKQGRLPAVPGGLAAPLSLCVILALHQAIAFFIYSSITFTCSTLFDPSGIRYSNSATAGIGH
jgi:hypothetical protein